VYHWWLHSVEVHESADNLHNLAARFLFRELVSLLELEVEILPGAKLEHGAERGLVDLEHVCTKGANSIRVSVAIKQ